MNNMDLTTVITLTGPKANVVKMLNAGILSLGFTNLVEDGDDLGAVIQKVTGDAMVFQFQDLLNTTGEPLPRTRIPMDEDYSEFNEDFGLKVADIIENEQSLTVITGLVKTFLVMTYMGSGISLNSYMMPYASMAWRLNSSQVAKSFQSMRLHSGLKMPQQEK